MMNAGIAMLAAFALVVGAVDGSPKIVTGAAPHTGRIEVIQPPEQGFFTKKLVYEGIPIKAPAVVSDQALFEGRSRLAMIMGRLPQVRRNLKAAGAELQIIGKDQVTSDLPEYRQMRGKPFDGKLTIDERTRGLGGLHTSCGEENLLRLEKDRYRGRDICVHEFAHNIYQYGVDQAIRDRFTAQMKRSMDKGLWVGAYSASNPHEFFAELTMWYWGTHGDLNMNGAKPADGREGLRAYDPEAFALFDEFYSGRMRVPRVEPRPEAED